MKRKYIASIFFLCLTYTFYFYIQIGRDPKAHHESWIIHGIAMTIPYQLKLPPHLDLIERDKANAIVDTVFHEIDKTFNCYNPYSELSRLNRHQSTEPFALSDELYNYLLLCSKLHSITLGMYDPTLWKVKQLWIQAMEYGKTLSNQELEILRQETGWEKVHLGNGFCTKLHPMVQIDLCGSIKGHCVDLIKLRLKKNGFDNFLFEWGGEISVSGKSQGTFDWIVQVKDSKSIFKHPLIDNCLASSGYEHQVWQVEDHFFTHIIDPSSLKPLSIKRIPQCITIEHSSCSFADAISTAAMCINPSLRDQWLKKVAVNYWIQERKDLE